MHITILSHMATRSLFVVAFPAETTSADEKTLGESIEHNVLA